mmetsp:Transcript_41601/g.134447  ORF Transcript_41601/g.134447 Transcript_41601/m.134447 type:complete len:517 (+) Transcript_41601:506-2056(+)
MLVVAAPWNAPGHLQPWPRCAGIRRCGEPRRTRSAPPPLQTLPKLREANARRVVHLDRYLVPPSLLSELPRHALRVPRDAVDLPDERIHQDGPACPGRGTHVGRPSVQGASLQDASDDQDAPSASEPLVGPAESDTPERREVLELAQSATGRGLAQGRVLRARMQLHTQHGTGLRNHVAHSEVLLPLALFHPADVRDHGGQPRDARLAAVLTTRPPQGAGLAHAVLESVVPFSVVPRAAQRPLAAPDAMTLTVQELAVVRAATLRGGVQHAVAVELVAAPLADEDLAGGPTHLALAFSSAPHDLALVDTATRPLLPRVAREQYRLRILVIRHLRVGVVRGGDGDRLHDHLVLMDVPQRRQQLLLPEAAQARGVEAIEELLRVQGLEALAHVGEAPPEVVAAHEALLVGSDSLDHFLDRQISALDREHESRLVRLQRRDVGDGAKGLPCDSREPRRPRLGWQRGHRHGRRQGPGTPGACVFQEGLPAIQQRRRPPSLGVQHVRVHLGVPQPLLPDPP